MTELLIHDLSPTASWSDVIAGLGEQSAMLDRLSPAERVVAVLLRQGLGNREIAQTLGKAESTVKKQVASCLKKCGAPTRMRLIAQLR